MDDKIFSDAARDEPVEAAQRFFTRLGERGLLPADLSPVDAASAALCALSLRLRGSKAQELIQSLPTSLRALFTLCVRHRREPPVSMDLPEFLALIAGHLEVTEAEARQIALAVFAAIADELPASTVREVAGQLPPDLRTLWPSHPKAA